MIRVRHYLKLMCFMYGPISVCVFSLQESTLIQVHVILIRHNVIDFMIGCKL